ncbi:hypothetical protein JR316_0009098 [Psilocybe cubensis]|uniref:Uncharacterized protein n=1 Tax=Psilocybe cubensis TaxID=181762 RepID=A0ACB8GSK1_PSICU|nr:hypothetical protein JR316_0009098 [Psilocybe cubensis]KAH9478641.1 hypothetical protein JR316_0009098 [Psilocybe cubensis]
MPKSSRKSKKNTLYEDDAEAADVVTYKMHSRTTRTGRRVEELIKVPLTSAERYHIKEAQGPAASTDVDEYDPGPAPMDCNSGDEDDMYNCLRAH